MYRRRVYGTKKPSKYPNLGILDWLEHLSFGGVPEYEYLDIYSRYNDENGGSLNRSFFSKKFHALRVAGYIGSSKKEKIIVTDKGKEKLKLWRFKNLKLGTKKRDGRQRIIIFDIPEKLSHRRRFFREKLIEFECRKLQKSAYVTPYICEQEIGTAAKLLDIQSNVHVFIIENKFLF